MLQHWTKPDWTQMKLVWAWTKLDWAWTKPVWAWTKPVWAWTKLVWAWMKPVWAWMESVWAWTESVWAWTKPVWAWTKSDWACSAFHRLIFNQNHISTANPPCFFSFWLIKVLFGLYLYICSFFGIVSLFVFGWLKVDDAMNRGWGRLIAVKIARETDLADCAR